MSLRPLYICSDLHTSDGRGEAGKAESGSGDGSRELHDDGDCFGSMGMSRAGLLVVVDEK
jgi:hypothetical protein